MRTKRFVRPLVAFWGALLAVLTTALGAPAQAAGASLSAVDSAQLRGRAFLVSSVEVNSVPQQLFTGARLHLSFVEERIEVSADCGAAVSRVDLSGGRLALLDQVAVPSRCTGDDLRRLSWILWDLRTRPQWALDGGALTLLSPGGERIQLHDVAASTVQVTVSGVPFPSMWG